MALKVGDTVRLKSGSPLMTVTQVGVGENGQGCNCKWFDDKKELKSGTFPQETLEEDDGTVKF